MVFFVARFVSLYLAPLSTLEGFAVWMTQSARLTRTEVQPKLLTHYGLETEKCFIMFCLDEHGVCVCGRDRTRGLTFDFLPASFLIPASYFVLQASDADDSRQLRQAGERWGLQRHGSTQETGRLGGFGETGWGQTGAWPVVHLEEEEGAAGREETEQCTFDFFIVCVKWVW